MSARRHKKGSGFHTSMSSKDRRRRLRSLLARDGLTCALCGEQMIVEPRMAKEAATIDHVIPLAFGGTNQLVNLRLVHRACNEAAGAATQRELLRLRWTRGKSLDTGSAGR